MSEYKMKPCPFCGSRWIEISDVSKGVPWVPGGMVRVQCVDCGVTNECFSAREEDKAAEWWNNRAGNSSVLEALRKLDLECDHCAHRDECKKMGIACEGDCSECGHAECHCQTCLGNSKWEWKGVDHETD